ATVITGQLNVRAAPNPLTGAILTRINLGETYPVVGRNAASTWLQLNVNGLIGWVNARYVAASNLANVPITG
ncbi:MAG: SH3 domain-containing protein, partial [Chloroflexi bacterium]|nr:SH3 domain-containing protein [Chloroflexota bacterium]